MDYKKLITSTFKKEELNVYGKIDKEFKAFITKINKSPDINTLHCCQGHPEQPYDTGCFYLTFNVSENGWDIFWNQILPQLSYEKFMYSTILQVPDPKEPRNYVGISIYGYYTDDADMRYPRLMKMQEIFTKFLLPRKKSVSLQTRKTIKK